MAHGKRNIRKKEFSCSREGGKIRPASLNEREARREVEKKKKKAKRRYFEVSKDLKS